ncbi:hypothetical protein BS47DRAFT_1355166 [Hydnum rufescens UP504]|uniref:Uncharacterized protein n=1 Tax=Hydnum rufescens UP504 TaxID=1448309 RepID=A0A9P6AEV0_9AGAM|nr:hypothetical protein BS47DRAFT_1355166 [Hydnum rufescens UP504]
MSRRPRSKLSNNPPLPSLSFRVPHHKESGECPSTDTPLYPLVAIFAAVDQQLGSAVAKALGHPSVKPLQVKPASEVIKFKPDVQ